ncbi:serine/threonine-protein kinase, partial [Streptomyces sp. 150FB]|uniref:serine/threonine-protein kinase n=1 Tax=Streptomyces sp. 150FB TaxID=1576605 RepID=UPI0012376F7E
MKSLQPGDPASIGGYRLLGRLGAGGMGEVFFGRSAGGRPVAVKVIRSEYAGDSQFRERFAREIEAARRVGGFHTAPVVDADPAADPPWMVTAYVAGPSLHDAVAQHGPLPADALRTLGAGLSEGLGAIHACGLIHRDLKPGNVLLADDGPRIIDFGIARATGAGAAMTTAGAILGTYLFMSPEQTYGRQAGPASDVFSLGGVLAFAATGTSPFDGDSLPAVIYRITSEQPDLSGVPTEFGLRELVAACLSKDPADRPSVTDVLRQLGDTVPGDGWPPATVLDVPSGPGPTVTDSAGAGPAPEPVRGAAPGG